MNLKKDSFYLLQDISPQKPASASFYGLQLFRPFQRAALKNGFHVSAVSQVNQAGKLPAVEFLVAEDVAHVKLQKALNQASKKLKRDLAIRNSK